MDLKSRYCLLLACAIGVMMLLVFYQSKGEILPAYPLDLGYHKELRVRNPKQTTPHDSCANPRQQASIPISKVETLVLFIGLPRTGSTLVGSILDAHPHALIANEYNIVNKWDLLRNCSKTFIINELVNNSMYAAVNAVRGRKGKKLHNYHIANQWQGKVDKFAKVIGDKKARETSTAILRGTQDLDALIDKMNMPVKYIHVARNPYDTIATIAARWAKNRRAMMENSSFKANNSRMAWTALHDYSHVLATNRRFISSHSKSVITINYSKLIKQPRETILHLCSFLDLECTEDYLEDCQRSMFASETNTRKQFVWPSGLEKAIQKEIIEKYWWLRDFKM